MSRLFFEKRMPAEIIIDRWAINQTVLSGIDLFLASRATSWNMNPIRLRPGEHLVVPDYFLMAPTNLFEVEDLVNARGLTVKTSIQAYVPGFAEPIRTEMIDRLPFEYWTDFMNNVRHAYLH